MESQENEMNPNPYPLGPANPAGPAQPVPTPCVDATAPPPAESDVADAQENTPLE